MNCYVHDPSPAVGLCAVCQRALCRECVRTERPRLVCVACSESGAVIGFEWKSRARIGSWPLVHICLGNDAATLRPKVARGVIAIGGIAVGGLAIGGVTLGLVSFGGVSIGLLLAFGGMAAGLGLSFGGLAVGSIAIGGLAVGFEHAVGGAAFAKHVVDGQHCDLATRDLVARLLDAGGLPPHCRP